MPNWKLFEKNFPLFSELDLQTAMVGSRIWLSAKWGSEGQRGLSERCHFLHLWRKCCSRGPQTMDSFMLRIIKAINPWYSYSAAVSWKKKKPKNQTRFSHRHWENTCPGTFFPCKVTTEERHFSSSRYKSCHCMEWPACLVLLCINCT